MKLTKQEAQLLFAAVDTAVKAGGIQVAGQVMQIAAKLNEFINVPETKEKNKEDKK